MTDSGPTVESSPATPASRWRPILGLSLGLLVGTCALTMAVQMVLAEALLRIWGTTTQAKITEVRFRTSSVGIRYDLRPAGRPDVYYYSELPWIASSCGAPEVTHLAWTQADPTVDVLYLSSDPRVNRPAQSTPDADRMVGMVLLSALGLAPFICTAWFVRCPARRQTIGAALGVTAGWIVLAGGVGYGLGLMNQPQEDVERFVILSGHNIAEALDDLVGRTSMCLDVSGKWEPKQVEYGHAGYDRLKLDTIAEPVTDSLARHMLRDDTRLRVLLLGIKLGIQGSDAKLVEVLRQHGNKPMAEDFLNCSHPPLQSAARRWAHEHGYQITTGTGSHRAAWGVR